MIADVTAGCAIAKAIARCVSFRPAASATGISCSTASRRRSSDRWLAVPGGPPKVGLLSLARSPGEQALRQRAPHQRAHPVLLHCGEHLALDPTVQDRVRRLLGAEPPQYTPPGPPPRPPDLGRRGGGGGARPA